MSDSDERDVGVSVRADLYKRIERRVADSEFNDVDEYIEFVLEELLSQLEGTGSLDGDTSGNEEVQDRLKELGYLE